jgi:single-stranded-DNA-specific exonuclease
LLCSQNLIQAEKYARSLNSYNQDRQLLQKESITIAENIFSQTTSNTRPSLIFIYDPSFNPGIIGLVAGNLTEKYYLPSVVITANDGLAKGSCRSVAGLNIIKILRQFSDLFIDLGGHSSAAGLLLKLIILKNFK